MPRPQHPPTPASSTEIRSKDGAHFNAQMSFELPPPAVAGVESRPSTASKSSSGSSCHPTSPTSPAMPASEVVKLRRRSSVAQAPSKAKFALPPPPTRSRKIIQMKPKGQNETADDADEPAKGDKAAATPKKKQPSTTSVAGRKIARKTAHSLIERRRRSKMNEEFGVLKDMIPACTGEMHKLAILQASIDYVRYLEDCISQLKTENSRSESILATNQIACPPALRDSFYSSPSCPTFEEDDEDMEMDGSEQVSPKSRAPPSHQPLISPARQPQQMDNYRSSYSSASTDYRHYSCSSTTSPAMGPGAWDCARSIASAGSTLTSPALLPQKDIDHEVTTALLMLNTERRNTNGSGGGRGMSVQDLLSA